MPELHHPIEISEEAGVRRLHFGSPWIQGAMRIRRPYALELAYTREMMAALLLRPETNWPARVLLIGLGTGSIAKYIYRNFPETRITVVEIDDRMIPIAQLHFKLPLDPQRLKLIISDGADYLQQARGRFDAIFVDGFDARGRANTLDSIEFYTACRHRLTERGLMICNLLGHNRGFQATKKRLQQSFEQRLIVFPSLDSGNTIAFGLGVDGLDICLEEMREQAKKIKISSGLDLAPTISRLEQHAFFKAGKLSL